MTRKLLILLSFLTSLCAQSQELEYKMEIGATLGGSFYLGDCNYSGFYKNTKPAGGVMARYNINPRMALKANLIYAGIGGNSAENTTKFPDGANWKFSSSVIDLGCQYELNFFGFGTGEATYKGHKRITPYLLMGLGFTYAKAVEPESGAFTLNLPIGVGVKYKVKPRLNVGLDWTMRFTFSDKLDGLVDPFNIKSGTLKNKDSYCLTMLYVTYDFMPKYRKCNN